MIDRTNLDVAGITLEEYEMLYAAVQLLLDNLDLLEWAICLTDTWSAHATQLAGLAPGAPAFPFVPDGSVTSYNTGHILPCMMGYLTEGFDIYLVEQFWTSTGSTGAATNSLIANEVLIDQFDRRPGPIIPIKMGGPFYGAHAQAVASGGAVGLCAALAVAQILVHELMHICVDGEWDQTNCFALQNMAAMTFGWALAKRMECLQNVACCPKVSDTFFMTSEPDFLVPAEPAPFDWVGFLAGAC